MATQSCAVGVRACFGARQQLRGVHAARVAPARAAWAVPVARRRALLVAASSAAEGVSAADLPIGADFGSGAQPPGGVAAKVAAAAAAVAAAAHLFTSSLSTHPPATVADLMTQGALRSATPDQPLSSAVSKLDKVRMAALGQLGGGWAAASGVKLLQTVAWTYRGLPPCQTATTPTQTARATERVVGHRCTHLAQVAGMAVVHGGWAAPACSTPLQAPTKPRFPFARAAQVTGLAVVDENNVVVGVISIRDINRLKKQVGSRRQRCRERTGAQAGRVSCEVAAGTPATDAGPAFRTCCTERPVRPLPAHLPTPRATSRAPNAHPPARHGPPCCYEQGTDMSDTVGQHMSTPPIVVRPDTATGEAAAIMLSKKIHRLPVVDEAGKFIG